MGWQTWLGWFCIFKVGFWSAACAAAYLVHADAFPEVGPPTWVWGVNGALYAAFAVVLLRPRAAKEVGERAS